MTNWYTVVKTIKGHQYLYRQRTWREGSRVRTQSQYLGPAGGHGAVAPARPRRPLTEAKAKARWSEGTLSNVTADQVSDKYKDAILKYTTTLHKNINAALRRDAVMDSHTKNLILLIRNVMFKLQPTLEETITLYRGCIIREDLVIEGKCFDDFGLTSFSVDKQTSAMFHKEAKVRRRYKKVLLQMTAHEGEKGFLPLRGMTQFMGEHEILSVGYRYRILKITEEDGITRCEVERVEKAI